MHHSGVFLLFFTIQPEPGRWQVAMEWMVNRVLKPVGDIHRSCLCTVRPAAGALRELYSLPRDTEVALASGRAQAALATAVRCR